MATYRVVDVHHANGVVTHVTVGITLPGQRGEQVFGVPVPPPADGVLAPDAFARWAALSVHFQAHTVLSLRLVTFPATAQVEAQA